MERSTMAVVPARGGSKGLERKNLKYLCCKPLIAYAIEAGLGCSAVDRVLVSTEDEEIAEVARGYGAEVPFMRPDELAGDDVPMVDVLRHLLSWLEDNEERVPDFLVNLSCTSPFKTPEDVKAVIERLVETGAEMVRTVTAVEGVFHPYWALRVEKGAAFPFIEGVEGDKYFKRQLLPKAYRLNAVVDGFRVDHIMRGGKFFVDRFPVIEIPAERAVDIDCQMDLEFAEFLINRNNLK